MIKQMKSVNLLYRGYQREEDRKWACLRAELKAGLKAREAEFVRSMPASSSRRRGHAGERMNSQLADILPFSTPSSSR